MNATIQDYVRAYKALGWRGLPIVQGEKTPVVRGWADSDFTYDFTDWNGNLGIVTGAVSGIFAVDLDGASGLASWQGLLDQHNSGQPVVTLEATTRSGGRHLLFKHPGDHVASRAGVLSGLDVRGDGGQIVVEPSKVAPGGYAWTDWDPTTGDAPTIATAPDWLLALVTTQRKTESATVAHVMPILIADTTRQDLQDALKSLDSDIRDTWIAVGHALYELGEVGFTLWDQWSQTSAKYQPGEPQRLWPGFAKAVTGYRAVFHLAQQAGWGNPLKGSTNATTEPHDPGFMRETIHSTLLTEPIPDQPFMVETLVPENQVTLLAGHGGSGKSSLALTLAVHVALGLPFAGLQVARGRVCIVSLEDDVSTVKRRVRAIFEALQANPAHAEQIDILDGTETGGLVYEVQASGVKSLAKAKRLFEQIQSTNARLYVVDNASDALEANENERRAVRFFIRALRSLVRDSGAVLLLAHVNKNNANGSPQSQKYSGSTAWHNSVRSRLVMEPTASGATLTHEKSNFGPLLPGPIQLVRTGEVLQAHAVAVPHEDPFEAVNRERAIEEAVIEAIKEATGNGAPIYCSDRGASHGLGILCALLPTYPKPEIKTALSRLQAKYLIKQTAWRTPDRKLRNVWEVTPAPNAPNAPNDEFGAISAIGAEAAPNAPN